ncbi:hypothetical protein CYMTET_21699 [Cymbomonas tetramitiformis]|uniref:HEAT repeat domain-containing protein n=1 Tax=Cymbomonas tetramitiformis TaxID=36881 RepID=A0AAE0G1W1_9CHLO|nr:hypothetical protein CYMTET_21699 [Cymbomonas tetramitiformis]
MQRRKLGPFRHGGMEDGNADVRRAAVEALGRLGEHAVPHAGDILARLMEHADARVRTRAAVEALGRPGENAALYAGDIAARLDEHAKCRREERSGGSTAGESGGACSVICWGHRGTAGRWQCKCERSGGGVVGEAMGRLWEHAVPHAGGIAARREDAVAGVKEASLRALTRLRVVSMQRRMHRPS